MNTTTPPIPLRRGLKSKLILMMMVVGTLPLLLAIIISYVQGNKSLQEVIGASFQALAFETSSRLESIIQEEIERNAYLASHPTLILTAKANSETMANSVSTNLDSQVTAEEMESITNNAGSRILKTFLKALIHTAGDAEFEPELLQAVQSVNNRQKHRVFEKIMQHFDGELRNKTIAVWGLAFKPNTDDLREAPSLELLEALWREGAETAQ